MSKKRIALLMAVVMVLGVAVGSTMAWLTDSTKEVVNTFTVGDINIDLTETGVTGETKLEKNYKYVPGDTWTKDPTVTVDKDSEDCYVFVKLVVDDNSCTVDNETADPVVTFSIANGWTPYATYTDIKDDGTYYFYRVVEEKDLTKTEGETTTAANAVYPILACKNSSHTDCTGCVKLSTQVTKGMISKLGEDGSNLPNLTFTAHAVQKANIAQNGQNEVAAAYNILFPATTTNP